MWCTNAPVFSIGATDRWPFESDGRRVTGQGICDMKGGIVVALRAMDALRTRPASFGLVELVSVPDEEERDRAPELIHRHRGFDAALCMECGREDGSVVSERKGGIWVRLVARMGEPPTQARSRTRDATPSSPSQRRLCTSRRSRRATSLTRR